MVSGLLGGLVGGGGNDFGEHVRRGMEWGTIAGLGSPMLKTLPLRAIEGGGMAGAGILKALTSNLPRQALVSAVSQKGANITSQQSAELLKRIISKKR